MPKNVRNNSIVLCFENKGNEHRLFYMFLGLKTSLVSCLLFWPTSMCSVSPHSLRFIAPVLVRFAAL